MKKITIIFTVALFYVGSLWAQDLPKWSTPEEAKNLEFYKGTIGANPFTITTPPSAPLRSIAEWEELSGVCITWETGTGDKYRPILIAIAKEVVKQCSLYVLCDNCSNAQSWLGASGVTSNVQYITGNHNSIWIRDYGPNSGYTSDVDSLVMVDWIYNRSRPYDNAASSVLGTATGIPVYEMSTAPTDLVHTGGNYMTDGLGNAFSSKLVLTENSSAGIYNLTDKTEQEVKDLMDDWMGQTSYALMDVLPYDGIHHIDMHMKLLDESTLMVGEYPAGTADGPTIEANLQYVLSNFTDPWGNPYKIIRVPQPDDWNNKFPNQSSSYYVNYANALFLNEVVLIPKYGIPEDTTAERIWQESLPGYTIVPLDCKIIIQAGGAIHCITKEVGAESPIWITHERLPEVTSVTNWSYKVEAKIMHKDGIAAAKVYYAIDARTNFQTADMTLTDAQNNIWTGYIPPQADGKKVYYYIEGEANGGKKQVRPIVAPEGAWEFEINTITAVAESNLISFTEAAFPNPSKGITCIPANFELATDVAVVLTDMLGREVAQIYSGHVPAGEKKFFINTENLSAGAYLIVMQSPSSKHSQKLMVR